MRLAVKILVLALVVLLVVLTMQNLADVQLRFLIWTFEAPRAAVLGLTFVIGALTGGLLARMLKRALC